MSRISRVAGVTACMLVLLGVREVTAQPKLRFTIETSGNTDLDSPVFTPDNKQLLAAAIQEKVFLDVTTGKEVHQWKTKSWWVNPNPLFSRDGKAVYFRDSRRVEGFEKATGKPLGRIEVEYDALKDKQKTALEATANGPDGQLVIAGVNKDGVCLWDLATGKTRDLAAAPGPIFNIRLSPDGGLLLATHRAGYSLYEVAAGKILYTGTPPEECQYLFGFSPDGKTIAWEARVGLKPDHVIRLVDPLTGKVRVNLKGHADYITSVAFSPNGKYVVTGSRDKSARIWELATGRSLVTLTFDGPVSGVQFSPNGRLLATGSEPRTIKVWELSLPEAK